MKLLTSQTELEVEIAQAFVLSANKLVNEQKFCCSMHL